MSVPRRDIAVVGASAGGVEALREVARGLPADVHAAVFVVLHTPAEGRTMLPRILERAGVLPAHEAVDGEPIRHGHVYVARPNFHLLVERDRVRVLVGPHENGLRPAADPLFRSAAHAYGPRVVGVVLSGSRDDGAAGLQTIKRAGGLAVIQDPQDAVFSGMPLSAMEAVEADHVLPAAAIGALIAQLAHQPTERGGADMTDALAGAGSAGRDAGAAETLTSTVPKPDGEASGLTCPECRGSLWEVSDGDNAWFECRVDHRYSLQSMLEEQARTVEAAIWAAVNVLEERAALLHKYHLRAQARGQTGVADRFELQADEAERHAESIRVHLLGLVQTLAPAVK